MIAAPPRRILMTTDAVGGVWVFSVSLARALSEKGVEVLLVTLGPAPTSRQRQMLAGCRGVSLRETDLRLEWQDPSGQDVARARDVLSGIADSFAPDLVHLNSFREATFDWCVPCVVVAHSDVESWAAACGETQSFESSEWRIYGSNVRAGLQSADAWAAPSRAYADEVARRYCPASKGHAIRNGTSAAGHGPRHKMPFVLSAGRVWDKAKNLSMLSSVAAGLPWLVRIAGPLDLAQGEHRAGIAGGCECLGEIPHAELLREMQAAAIFVSPSRYEPFGLSVLEAARSGCALLLSDIPTFRELWSGAAMFFAEGERGALLHALQSLCDDDVERIRLQRAAIDRAGAYTLENTVAGYQALYLSLSRDRGPAAERALEMQA